MTTFSRHPAQTIPLPLAKGGLLRRFQKLLEAMLLAARPKLNEPELSASQRYDIGMTDLRPVENTGAEQGLNKYPGSFAAMLNRSI
jgi:hypothetical protein